MKSEKKEASKMSYEELINEYEKLQIKYNNATLELNALKRIVFGSKREKVSENELVDIEQCSLFDNEQDIENNVQEQIAEQIEEITIYKKKNSKKKICWIREKCTKRCCNKKARICIK